MTAALIIGQEIFYLAGHPDKTEREFSSCQNLRISGRVSVQQRARIRAAAVEHIDRGNLATKVSFSVTRQFATTVAAELFAETMEDAAELSGILVLRADGNAAPDTYIYNCRAVVPPPEREVTGRSVRLDYTVDCGAFVPEGLTAYPPAPVPPALLTRIVDENGANGWEKWFDVGFDVPEILSGSAASTLIGSGVSYELIWSEDLGSWVTGRFVDCAGSPVDNGNGTWRYWCRSIYPCRAEHSTAHLWAEPTEGQQDTRNNPLTALRIAGALQSLPHFPYTMPTAAAQLQTDLRALGWTGATVTATSAVAWRIDIPSVPVSSYEIDSKIYWPYYISYGGLFAFVVDGLNFSGIFLNGAGVQTNMTTQFCRLNATSH